MYRSETHEFVYVKLVNLICAHASLIKVALSEHNTRLHIAALSTPYTTRFTSSVAKRRRGA